MMPHRSRPVAALLLVGLGVGCAAGPQRDPAVMVEPGVVDAARAFLGTLDAEQRIAVRAPLDSPSRKEWNFVPQQYPGLALAAMRVDQRDAVHRLVGSVLGSQGVGKVHGILHLEQVLHDMESAGGANAAHRNPEHYWVQLFGEPADTGAWAWRVQGHHLSLHVSVVDGLPVGVTPLFLGANPHRVPSGPWAGMRVLAAEEDLARELVGQLDAVQLERALLQAEAPADVVLGPKRQADFLGTPRGVNGSELRPAQRVALWNLVTEHVLNLRREFAAAELARIQAAGFGTIHFGWAGSVEPGRPHYYRIHGAHFVIEYDNTQNGANHVHVVWRDLQRDFGGDLLEHHLRNHEAAHGGAANRGG